MSQEPLEQRLERALAGRPADAEEQGWHEAWAALRQASGPDPAVDAEALAGDVLAQLAAERRRRAAWWSAGAVGIAASVAAVALWLRPPADSPLAWDDRPEAAAAIAEIDQRLANAWRPAAPPANPAALAWRDAVALAERWEHESL